MSCVPYLSLLTQLITFIAIEHLKTQQNTLNQFLGTSSHCKWFLLRRQVSKTIGLASQHATLHIYSTLRSILKITKLVQRLSMYTIQQVATQASNPFHIILCSSRFLKSLLLITQPPVGPSSDWPTSTIVLHAQPPSVAGYHCYLSHGVRPCVRLKQPRSARRGRSTILVRCHLRVRE